MIENPIGYPPGTIALFIALVTAFIGFDLFAHRKDKPISVRDAAIWSLVCVATAFAFAGYIYWQYGTDKAALFVQGYVLEAVLSVDNLMVFSAIFAAFSIPEGYRHRVLYYGIIGAIVFRLIFVTAGSAIYAAGPWVEFLFAAIIAWTAVKMLQAGKGEEAIVDYSKHWSVRMTERFFPVFPRLMGHKFLVTHAEVEAATAENKDIRIEQHHKRAAMYVTPLFLCLICVEVADVVFAFDSVPAILGVTKEPLLVYTAMMFSILNLRSLYFVLAALQRYLVHLDKAVIGLLFFIAGKMALTASNHMFHWPLIEIDPYISLMIVLGVLAAGVVASLIFPGKEEAEKAPVASESAEAEAKVEA